MTTQPHAPDTLATRIVVPYITAWTEEEDPPYELVAVPGVGIAYADESLTDRDHDGVLWSRATARPGKGRPDFARAHSLRQRRAMGRMLCQVCGGAADCSEDGALWLLQDHREDWSDWPNTMGVTEPPICLSCVHTSARLCPALRRGAIAIRVRRYPIAAVYGHLYTGSDLTTAEAATVRLNSPRIRWVRAVHLVRELNDCTVIPISELPTERTAR